MFGKKIKHYRRKNRMTIPELAKTLNCTCTDISEYEANKKKPSMALLIQISDIFGITPLDLLPNTTSLEFKHYNIDEDSDLQMGEEDLLGTPPDIPNVDKMSKDEFDSVMRQSIDEVKNGSVEPFDKVMKDIIDSLKGDD